MPEKISTADFEYTKAKYRTRVENSEITMSEDELEALFSCIELLKDAGEDASKALWGRSKLLLQIEEKTKHAAVKLQGRIRALVSNSDAQALDLRLFRNDAESLDMGLRALTGFRLLSQKQPYGFDIAPEDEEKVMSMIDDIEKEGAEA